MKRDLLSYSALNEFGKSANHIIDYWEGKKITTAAMIEGKLTHKLILESDKVDDEFVVYEKRRAGGEWEEFKQTYKDKEIVTTKEYDNCSLLASKAKEDPLFSSLLMKTTEVEKHVAWERLGQKFHGYIDGIGENNSFYFDIKTCQDAGEKFERDLKWNSMPMQAAMYLDWDGDLTIPYYIVALEKKAPYNVQVYKIGHNLIRKGENRYIELLKRYKEWDGKPQSYSKEIITVDV